MIFWSRLPCSWNVSEVAAVLVDVSDGGKVQTGFSDLKLRTDEFTKTLLETRDLLCVSLSELNYFVSLQLIFFR